MQLCPTPVLALRARNDNAKNDEPGHLDDDVAGAATISRANGRRSQDESPPVRRQSRRVQIGRNVQGECMNDVRCRRLGLPAQEPTPGVLGGIGAPGALVEALESPFTAEDHERPPNNRDRKPRERRAVSKPLGCSIVEWAEDALAHIGLESAELPFTLGAQHVAPGQILNQSVGSLRRAKAAGHSRLAQPIADEFRNDVAAAQGANFTTEVAGTTRRPAVGEILSLAHEGIIQRAQRTMSSTPSPKNRSSNTGWELKFSAFAVDIGRSGGRPQAFLELSHAFEPVIKLVPTRRG